MARIVHGTLVANTVTTVTLDSDHSAVEVLNRSGTVEIFVGIDGATPAVNGADSEILPAVIGGLQLPSFKKGATVVKLISSGTPSYTVRGL